MQVGGLVVSMQHKPVEHRLPPSFFGPLPFVGREVVVLHVECSAADWCHTSLTLAANHPHGMLLL
jgi:hypothetical protein